MKRPYKITVKPVLNYYNRVFYNGAGIELFCLYIRVTVNRQTTKIPTGYHISQTDFDANTIPVQVQEQIRLLTAAVKFERDRTAIKNLPRGIGKRFQLYKEDAVIGLKIFSRHLIGSILYRTVSVNKYLAWAGTPLNESIEEGLKILVNNGEVNQLSSVNPTNKLKQDDEELSLIEIIIKYESWARRIGLIDFALAYGSKVEAR